MKNVTAHTGRLHIIEQIDGGNTGNPRFLVRVDGWTCRTQVDSSLGYEMRNLDGRMVHATIGTHYGRPTLNSCEAVPFDFDPLPETQGSDVLQFRLYKAGRYNTRIDLTAAGVVSYADGSPLLKAEFDAFCDWRGNIYKNGETT